MYSTVKLQYSHMFVALCRDDGERGAGGGWGNEGKGMRGGDFWEGDSGEVAVGRGPCGKSDVETEGNQ